ncbi:probable chitinase 2 [Sitodiplosis mosellana]|uniref:probable chitinase 2 n=1 Tax=Sitodiplosis mosellana TaxID=263140 RepID=UPI0024446939|nr:probable chitinase 2 [Sitodiplosis mosellana]
MFRLVCILSILSVFQLNKAKCGATPDKIVVCHTLSKIDERLNNTEFKIENVDLNLCTHLVCIDDIWQTASNNEPWTSLTASYKRFTNLRTKYPHLKISVAVKQNPVDIIRIVTDKMHRKEFIEDASRFLSSHKLDGLELFWDFSKLRQNDESENFYNNEAPDKDIVISFIKELSRTLQRQNCSLTSSLVGINKRFLKLFGIADFSKHLNFINILPKYNFLNHSETARYKINETLNIIATPGIEATIENMIELGVPAAKIVMGIQFIGHSFSTEGYEEPCTHSEVCNLENLGRIWGFDEYFDNKTGMAFVNNEGKFMYAQFLRSFDKDLPVPPMAIMYESSRSVANIVRFALRRRIAGVMAFPIDADGALDVCDIRDDTFADLKHSELATVSIPYFRGTFPLLRTINAIITVNVEED